ncbi:hypothetical protein SGM_2093 [Streptomyces griseoaurantiacus M045]|uniref:Uncharacterized protein n=1 Tax=Streptomyces griseoaurantiacus M045 TaxID=996637 RepID=F3NG29_9ACTN|nr:hypothetical protein SGM_2093 [Streptomyces griseoaurantiacus M045]
MREVAQRLEGVGEYGTDGEPADGLQESHLHQGRTRLRTALCVRSSSLTTVTAPGARQPRRPTARCVSTAHSAGKTPLSAQGTRPPRGAHHRARPARGHPAREGGARLAEGARLPAPLAPVIRPSPGAPTLDRADATPACPHRVLRPPLPSFFVPPAPPAPPSCRPSPYRFRPLPAKIRPLLEHGRLDRV